MSTASSRGCSRGVSGSESRAILVTPEQVSKAAGQYFAEERSNTFEVKAATVPAEKEVKP